TWPPIGNALPEVVKAQPYEDRFAHDMVLGDMAPGPTVLGMVPVVPHHPIIILFEGIGIRLLPIYHNLVPTDLHLVVLVVPDDLFVEGNGPVVYLHGRLGLGHVAGPKIVY